MHGTFELFLSAQEHPYRRVPSQLRCYSATCAELYQLQAQVCHPNADQEKIEVPCAPGEMVSLSLSNKDKVL